MSAGADVRFRDVPHGRLRPLVDLVLLTAAGVAFALTPETIRGRKLRLRFQRLAVPKEVRTLFIQGATVAFASSAVAGLFGLGRTGPPRP